MFINTFVEEEVENQKITILIETETDYHEALAALDEQINASKKLWGSVQSLAEAIAVYEDEHDITYDTQDDS